jgi:hypothetical protein
MRFDSLNSIRNPVSLAVVVLSLAVAPSHVVAADDDQSVHGEAPPEYSVLSHTRGGALFVPKDLLEKHDQLLARVGRLKADIAAGRIKGEAALAELKTLEPQLDALRKELQAKKVLVSPVKVQKQTEELLFDLGPERMLIITADHLRVVGWDGPKVKCVLEKTLLAASDKPEPDEFKALRLTHRLGQAPELVGRTAEAVAQDERKFEAEHAVKPLSESQMAGRRQLVAEIQSSYAPFRAYQGKEVDVVGIEGLSGAQGNRQITVDIRSPRGGANVGSDWRRQAMLTVYVPRCQGLLLRGCLEGLDVQTVAAPLIVTDSDSLDRDYNGAFQIKKLDGPLTLYNVPLDRVEQVQGDVKIMATVEYANTGTRYEGGERTTIIPPPRECAIDQITGNLSAWFSRVNLKLGAISGVVDVKNETGDTKFAPSGPLADRAHRLVSVSGQIDVRLNRSALTNLPIIALTNAGTVKTNATRDELDEMNFTTGNPADGSRRDWRGLKSPRKRDGGDPLADFQRPGAALRGDERAAGLDIISQFGTIVVTVAP